MKKCRVKAAKRPKRRRSSSDSESDDFEQVKQIKTEEVTSQLVSGHNWAFFGRGKHKSEPS